MSVSAKTAQQIIEILEEELTQEQIVKLLRKLQTVEGNKSFKDTILLCRRLASM